VFPIRLHSTFIGESWENIASIQYCLLNTLLSLYQYTMFTSVKSIYSRIFGAVPLWKPEFQLRILAVHNHLRIDMISRSKFAFCTSHFVPFTIKQSAETEQRGWIPKRMPTYNLTKIPLAWVQISCRLGQVTGLVSRFATAPLVWGHQPWSRLLIGGSHCRWEAAPSLATGRSG